MEINKEFIESVRKSSNKTFDVCHVVASIGCHVFVDGVCTFAMNKMGFGKVKKLLSRAFINLALIPAVDEKITGYAFTQYENLVNEIADKAIEALEDMEDDEADLSSEAEDIPEETEEVI